MNDPARDNVAVLPDSIPLRRPGDTETPLSARFFNLVLICLNALLRFRTSDLLILNKATGGYFLDIDLDQLQQALNATAFPWKGEWDATVQYSVGDVVIRGSNNLPGHDYATILRDGGKAGTFICRVQPPIGLEPGEPNINPAGYWETVGRFATDTFRIKKHKAADGFISFNKSDGNILAGSEFDVDAVDANGHVIKCRTAKYCKAGKTYACRVVMSRLWAVGDPTETEVADP